MKNSLGKYILKIKKINYFLMEYNSGNKEMDSQLLRLSNSKKQLCFSQNFYQSFNNYENNENKTMDSQETIMPEEDSKNKIIINLQNNEMPKKRKKISKPNEIDKILSFRGEEYFFEEKEELNLSAIDKNENDISSNFSKVNNLCEIEMRNLYQKFKKLIILISVIHILDYLFLMITKIIIN